MTQPELSVIVPAYRASLTIAETVSVLRASLERLDATSEILVVPDGTLDDTAGEVARHHPQVRLCEYPDHRGKGYALKEGIRHSRGRYVAYIDADLELHPDALAPLLDLAREGADAALGSKRHPRSEVAYPLFRRVQSAVYLWLVRRLFGLRVSDTQTGMKLFRGDLLREVAPSLRSDGFAFDLELLVALSQRGASIAEGPVTLAYRFESTIGPGAVLQVAGDTIRIWWRVRRHGSPVAPHAGP